MKFKPSSLEKYIAELPEDLQMLALTAVKEEQERFFNKQYTKEEADFLEKCRCLGVSSKNHIENIIEGIFNK